MNVHKDGFLYAGMSTCILCHGAWMGTLLQGYKQICQLTYKLWVLDRAGIVIVTFIVHNLAV